MLREVDVMSCRNSYNVLMINFSQDPHFTNGICRKLRHSWSKEIIGSRNRTEPQLWLVIWWPGKPHLGIFYINRIFLPLHIYPYLSWQAVQLRSPNLKGLQEQYTLGHRNTFICGDRDIRYNPYSLLFPIFFFFTKSKTNTVQKLYPIKISWKSQFTKWGRISLGKFILLEVQKLNTNRVSVIYRLRRFTPRNQP